MREILSLRFFGLPIIVLTYALLYLLFPINIDNIESLVDLESYSSLFLLILFLLIPLLFIYYTPEGIALKASCPYNSLKIDRFLFAEQLELHKDGMFVRGKRGNVFIKKGTKSIAILTHSYASIVFTEDKIAIVIEKPEIFSILTRNLELLEERRISIKFKVSDFILSELIIIIISYFFGAFVYSVFSSNIFLKYMGWIIILNIVTIYALLPSIFKEFGKRFISYEEAEPRKPQKSKIIENILNELRSKPVELHEVKIRNLGKYIARGEVISSDVFSIFFDLWSSKFTILFLIVVFLLMFLLFNIFELMFSYPQFLGLLFATIMILIIIPFIPMVNIYIKQRRRIKSMGKRLDIDLYFLIRKIEQFSSLTHTEDADEFPFWYLNLVFRDKEKLIFIARKLGLDPDPIKDDLVSMRIKREEKKLTFPLILMIITSFSMIISTFLFDFFNWIIYVGWMIAMFVSVLLIFKASFKTEKVQKYGDVLNFVNKFTKKAIDFLTEKLEIPIIVYGKLKFPRVLICGNLSIIIPKDPKGIEIIKKILAELELSVIP